MEVIISGIKYVPVTVPEGDKSLLAALEVRFDSDAGHNLSVREWLRRMLGELWAQGENFNSKRPWGNSGWHQEIYTALVANRFISGKVDEDGYLQDYNDAEAKDYVLKLIRAVFNGVETKE